MITRKVIAEHIGDGSFMAMDEKGQLAEFSDGHRMLAAIRRSDAALQQQAGETVVITIEWRNVPACFQPPEVAR